MFKSRIFTDKKDSVTHRLNYTIYKEKIIWKIN